MNVAMRFTGDRSPMAIPSRPKLGTLPDQLARLGVKGCKPGRLLDDAIADRPSRIDPDEYSNDALLVPVQRLDRIIFR
jgi:hypothetical protein